MDLIETSHLHSNRHPWEIARVISFIKILAQTLCNNKHPQTGDVGLGDGFIGRLLFVRDKQLSGTSLDIILSLTQ